MTMHDNALQKVLAIVACAVALTRIEACREATLFAVRQYARFDRPYKPYRYHSMTLDRIQEALLWKQGQQVGGQHAPTANGHLDQAQTRQPQEQP